MSATKPISTPGYLLGVLAGTVVCAAFVVVAASHDTADPLFTPLGMLLSMQPAMWLASALVGLPMFILLRKQPPVGSLGRFAFVMLVVAPIVILVPCLGGVVLIMHAFFSKLATAAAIPLITIFGGMVCWGVDRASLFACVDGQSLADEGSLQPNRQKLRSLVRAALRAVEWVVALCLSITLLVMYSSLYSALSAPRIVFALAYCWLYGLSCPPP